MVKQSMNAFLQQAGTLLYRYLRKRGLAHEDAEDIIQDTCYKFLLHKNGIQSDKVMSWLYRVATNQFYDLKRKETRHPTTELDEVQLTSLIHIPEIQMLKKEKLKDIQNTLETLSILHQELLILKYELGLSYKEISLNSAQKVMDDIHIFNEISAPNVQISNQVYDDNLLGGKITTTTYKVLGVQHRPYIWKPIKSNYNLFGTLTRSATSSPIQIEGSESLAETYQIERFNDYTGDREMFFYHPKISYDHYKDNISELNQLEKNTLVELAISFDDSYSFGEIKSKLPSEVQVDWWWVDAYTDDTLDFFKQGQNTISVNDPYIYGFQSEQSKPKPRRSSNDEVETFIRNIELLRKSKNFEWETNQVYQALVGENGAMEKSDVKITGAVVTGTPEQLKSLQGQTYIKGSIFGVISNQK